MNATAILSSDRRYRYELQREWDAIMPAFVVIGLNPSTADETKDDPTIRRCIRFAKDHGCGSLVMLNLFAFRSTDPAGLWSAVDPIGPDNDATLAWWAASNLPRYVVAAWGAFEVHPRVTDVVALFGGLECFGRNKNGSPKHPLYVPAVVRVTPWRGTRRA